MNGDAGVTIALAGCQVNTDGAAAFAPNQQAGSGIRGDISVVCNVDRLDPALRSHAVRRSHADISLPIDRRIFSGRQRAPVVTPHCLEIVVRLIGPAAKGAGATSVVFPE